VEGDSILKAVVFICEYVRNHMLLPGQVENWVVINNLNKLSIRQLPAAQMKTIISVTSNNYAYKLGKGFILNCTSFQMFCYRLFEVFIDEETKAKASFFGEQAP